MTAPRGNLRGQLPDSWRVDLPVFDGPLDLLLQLVRVNEVEITELPIALICDQFHEYLERMEELDLDIAGEYIYEAALLIQLKARMLLPTPPLAEVAEDGDPRDALVERLLEYQRLKEAAQALAESEGVRSGMWTRTPQEPAFVPPEAVDGTLDLEDISLFDLLVVFREVLQRFDREHPPALVYRGEDFPIRAQSERFLRLAEQGKPYDLLDDMLALSCRAEAIAAFLAVLELSRLQLIRLHQTSAGDLLFYRTTRQVGAEELRSIPR